MDQGKLNKKVLNYFKERLKNYSYCTEEFIKSEELRAASIDDFELAEAIKQALKHLKEKKEN